MLLCKQQCAGACPYCCKENAVRRKVLSAHTEVELMETPREYDDEEDGDEQRAPDKHNTEVAIIMDELEEQGGFGDEPMRPMQMQKPSSL